MIEIHINDICLDEKTYILKTLLKDFLGLEYCLIINKENKYYTFKLDQKELSIPDLFFVNYNVFGKEITYPIPDSYNFDIDCLNLKVPVKIKQKSFPVLYSLTGKESLEGKGDFYKFGIDIFGACFFLLSRVEEINQELLDIHGRYLAKSSFSHKNNLLHRPIVNEYLEVLWALLNSIWPSLKRNFFLFNIIPSHDVDNPFSYHIKTHGELIKRLLIGAVKLCPKNLKGVIDNFNSYKNSGLSKDPIYTFDFIMDVSERANIKSAFYFITDQKHLPINGNYLINDPLITSLLTNIHQRGHEIGLHPSYYTFKDGKQIKMEFKLLRDICIQNNIIQELWGGRQHVLRWDTSITPRVLDNAGINYDSTLCYAEAPGFRSGTCFEYNLFDLFGRKELKIKERPLIVMECSVTEKRYLGLGISPDAFNVFKGLKDECKFYDGNYTVLWHNDLLENEEKKDFYISVINS
jgi:hypothetical protein